MRTYITLLVLALTASSVMSACAGDNQIATLYGLTGLINAGGSPAGTPVTVTSAMSVCGFVVGTTPAVCCTESQITNTIKTYLSTTKTTLEGLAGKRDEHIILQRGKVVTALGSLRKINELAATSVASGYAAVAKIFVGYAGTIAANFTTIVENFQKYQEARATCVNALLKAEASFACASCMASFPTGVVPGTSPAAPTVTIDNTLLTQLNTACYNYIDYSARQSTIISAGQYSAGIASLASALEKAKNNDNTGASADLTSAWNSFKAITNSATNEEKPVTIPTVAAGCTADKDCSAWIESTLFNTNGLLKNAGVILGGTEQILSFATSRESENPGRRLAAGGFVQDLSKITYDVTFSNNPGNVDNTKNAKSALRNGVVAVAVAALALFF